MEEQYCSTYPAGVTNGKSPSKRALYRNQDETLNNTSYQVYPTQKPFINDNYNPSRNKPMSSFPENQRPAVISALHNLQEKIHKLELERGAAENNLKSLAAETHKYKDIFQRKQQQENVEPAQTIVSKHTQELESQLTAAETRSQLLEKQLAYMRRMVENAESDRQEAVIKSTQLIEQQQKPPKLPVFDPQNEKINNLEREQLKLTATQTLAENKIRELEERLKEEQHKRQLMQEKAVELNTVEEAARILSRPDSGTERPHSKKVKKKKKTIPNKKQKIQQQQQQVPPPAHIDRDRLLHYRLNLADIPFVAGKSSTPSHSVGANVQRVLSLMKRHNMALCNDQYEDQRSTSPSSGSSSDLDNDLADLLLQLQDEFGQMSYEHQELSKQINEISDPGIKEDLERELDALVGRMEAKSQQISKVRRHQQKMDTRKKKKADVKKRSKSANHKHNSEVEVTTTIKTKGHNAGYIQVRPSSVREVSLNVLKDMKKLQTTLRKDDLHWE